MEPTNYPTLHRWDTPCSDVADLDFHGLVDDGQNLLFSVRDNEFIYEFCFETIGPYQIADEGFLACYQGEEVPGKPWSEWPKRPNFDTDARGWTYLVSNSAWQRSFNQEVVNVFFGSHFDDVKHYAVMTSWSCLDILACSPPTIKVTKIIDAK